MKDLIESLEDRPEEELLILLGRGMAAQEEGRRLKGEDLRHALSLGRRWFPALKLEIRHSVCSSEVVRDAVRGETLANRVAIVAVIVAHLVEHYEILEEGAVAFSVLLLREGLQSFCKGVWPEPVG